MLNLKNGVIAALCLLAAAVGAQDPAMKAPANTVEPAQAPVQSGGTNSMQGIHRIVFCGNSLTDGSAWCDWVIETLQANGYPNLILFNAGVAGNSTAQLKARYAKDVLAVKPDLVVVNVGTRDGKPPEDYRRDMGEIVAATRKTGAKMILMTPSPIRDPSVQRYRSPVYAPIIRELAQQYDCWVIDSQALFDEGRAAGHEMWGPDGVHHTLHSWRAMARAVLDVLGCHAPLVEKTSLYYHAVTDWRISPPVPWKAAAPVVLANMPEDYDPIAAGKGAYPELPTSFDGWRKFDREAEIAKTSWWQKSWLERGGVMPMGQELSKDKPGTPSHDAGAFGLAIVTSETERKTTMHVGGSLPYAVWLNGQLVWNGNFLHGYHPSADRITVTLRKGENQILVFSNWLFYISLGEI